MSGVTFGAILSRQESDKQKQGQQEKQLSQDVCDFHSKFSVPYDYQVETMISPQRVKNDEEIAAHLMQMNSVTMHNYDNDHDNNGTSAEYYHSDDSNDNVMGKRDDDHTGNIRDLAKLRKERKRKKEMKKEEHQT